MIDPVGPRLLGAIAIAIAAMCAALVVIGDSQADAASLVIRWTARTSFALFLLVYIARPATQLRPRTFKRLLARRKWIGLGFAVSHAFHLAGIVALAWPDPGAFVRDQAPTTLVAVVAYLVLFAMAVTSIERVRKAMPPPLWKRVHRTGVHLFWLVFAFTYAGAIATATWYVLPVVLLAAAAGIRAAASLRGKSPARRAERMIG